MPIYLVTYHGGPGMPQEPAAVQQMVSAFQTWVSEVGSAIRDPGAPLGPAKSVSSDGVSNSGPGIGGYSLIKADDLDAAVGLVKNHPFVGRGGTLQVSEAVAP